MSVESTEITVVKKNEIIPAVIECDSDKPEFSIPDTCPICGDRTQVVKRTIQRSLCTKMKTAKESYLANWHTS